MKKNLVRDLALFFERERDREYIILLFLIFL